MDLSGFLRESNAIEGIHRPPLLREITAAQEFLALEKLTIGDVCSLVSAFQPNAVIRNSPDLNVRVGNHIAPRGGPEIVSRLGNLLERINSDDVTPYWAHVEYETLHPFTDGNGRSGRMIWAWHRRYRVSFPLGFLHEFYYQTLANSRATPPGGDEGERER